jgi:hypothetical protein
MKGNKSYCIVTGSKRNKWDDLNSRHFRNRSRQYLKEKIYELATNSKNKEIRDLYRGINGFQRSYQSRSNFMKDGNGDLLADVHNILNTCLSY